jgi:hypothetical protein
MRTKFKLAPVFVEWTRGLCGMAGALKADGLDLGYLHGDKNHTVFSFVCDESR